MTAECADEDHGIGASMPRPSLSGFSAFGNSALAAPAIINEVRGINRVAYDISSKPPATIEWE